MKNNDLLILGALAVGGYFLFKNMGDKGNNDSNGYSGDGNAMFTPVPIIAPPTIPDVAPIIDSGAYSANIFIKTKENASDRFINAPGSGGGGVYDRYAQQSIRKETATVRAIFGTPKTIVTPEKVTVKPEIKKLFNPKMSFG